MLFFYRCEICIYIAYEMLKTLIITFKNLQNKKKDDERAKNKFEGPRDARSSNLFFGYRGIYGRFFPNSVLPSFYQALTCTNTIVKYQVTLFIQLLVNKYGMKLEKLTWSTILDMIEQVIAHTGKSILIIFQ